MYKRAKHSLSPAATLPPEVTAQLLADVDAMAGRMARQIVTDMDLPEEFRTIGYLRTVPVACRDALRTIVRLLHDGRGPRPGDLDRLGLMGAQQAEKGVPLEVLLSAYRLAAKIVWHEVIGGISRSQDLSPATVIAITGEVLEYVDLISASVGQAYLQTRERLMRQRDRDRDHVLQRLLAGDSSNELRRLAATAGLSLQPPYRVYACAFEGPATSRALEAAWSRGALVAGDEPGMWIILTALDADSTTFWDALAREVHLGGRDGRPSLVRAAGPVAVTLGDLGPATRQAREALRVGRRLDPEATLHDHAQVGVYATLAGDPDSLRRFVAKVLGPLASPRGSRFDDLRLTLRALLTTPSLGEAAAALGLHRHTVVYRSRRLVELGIDIDNPEQRHRLWLALLGQRLLGEDGVRPGDSGERTAAGT